MTQMNVIYQGQLHCHAEHAASGATLFTDAPVDNGGKGEGFSPTDLVATALAACVLTMMAKKAESLGVPYREPRITAEKHMKTGWCPKMYAASNKSVVDIEKSDGKCFEVIGHLLGKTAGFAYRAAYPLA